MMSVKRDTSYQRMLEYDRNLTAYDFGTGFSCVIDEEGSVFTIRSSFLMKDPEDSNYLWLLSEHHLPILFHLDEVVHYSCDNGLNHENESLMGDESVPNRSD